MTASSSAEKKNILIQLLDYSKTGSDSTAYLLEVEGDYAGFLGIDISKSTTIDGALELLQTGLIDRILAALSLIDDTTNVCTDPAEKKALGKDKNGPVRKEQFRYWNVALFVFQFKTRYCLCIKSMRQI